MVLLLLSHHLQLTPLSLPALHPLLKINIKTLQPRMSELTQPRITSMVLVSSPMLSLGYVLHEFLGSGGSAAMFHSQSPRQCVLPAISARESPTATSN